MDRWQLVALESEYSSLKGVHEEVLSQRDVLQIARHYALDKSALEAAVRRRLKHNGHHMLCYGAYHPW